MGSIGRRRGPFVPDGGDDEEEREPGILEQADRILRGLPPREPTGIFAQVDRILRGLPPREPTGILAQAEQKIQESQEGWPPFHAGPIPDDKVTFSNSWPTVAHPVRAGQVGGTPSATPAMVAMAGAHGWEIEGTRARAFKGATLSGLAQAITGNPDDCALLGFKRDPRTMQIGERVDITPLLRRAAGEIKREHRPTLPEVPAMPQSASDEQKATWFGALATHAIQAKKESGHKMFVSTQLAICAFETGWGTSKSFVQGHSIGGVKGSGDAGGGRYGTQEVERRTGERVSIQDTFAHYTSWVEGFKAQGRLTLTKRYATVATAASPEEQVKRLYDAGYATEKKEVWVGGVQSIIDKYDLRKYDKP